MTWNGVWNRPAEISYAQIYQEWKRENAQRNWKWIWSEKNVRCICEKLIDLKLLQFCYTFFFICRFAIYFNPFPYYHVLRVCSSCKRLIFAKLLQIERSHLESGMREKEKKTSEKKMLMKWKVKISIRHGEQTFLDINIKKKKHIMCTTYVTYIHTILEHDCL